METILELRDYVYGKTIEKTGAVLLTLVILWGTCTDIYGSRPVEHMVSSVGASQVLSFMTEESNMLGIGKMEVFSDITKMEMVVPEVMKPEAITAETEKLETIIFEMAKPEAITPEVVKPEVIISEMAKPEAAAPEMVKPEAIVPEETRPDMVIPEVQGPEAVVPEEENQGAAVPEISIIDKEEVLPETTAPEETVPEITSPFLIDENGMLYGFLPEYASLGSGYLELPQAGCTGIRAGAFSGGSTYVAEVSVPAGITYIEDGALNNLMSLEWITVLPGNPQYISIDGVLFDSTGTKLIAFPPARIGGYAVPDGVTEIAANAFANTSLSVIDIRGCAVSENCLLNISASCSIIR